MQALYDNQLVNMGNLKQVGGFIDELVVNNKELAYGLLQTLGLELELATAHLSLPGELLLQTPYHCLLDRNASSSP